MPSNTMASSLLDAAESLLLNSARKAAFRRRAVSTAYYAVFHALAKLCTDYLTRSARRGTYEYARVYRSLDHGSLNSAFGQLPLRDNPILSSIGAAVVRLQAERHQADYHPPVAGQFSHGWARQLIDQAREAVIEIEKIKPQNKDCRTLATCLLFKERRL
jgi:uncharacterized protein (UPF0332 family)